VDLREAWDKYVELFAKGDIHEAQRFYLEEIWPKVVAQWRERPRGDVPENPVGLSVHTLGTSPEAAVLAALAFKSREVHLLYTADTKKHLAFVESWVDAPVIGHLVDRENPEQIYNALHALVEGRDSVPFVALDMTGGTKVMSAALAAAGFVLRASGRPIDVFYVSNDQYEPIVRRPVAGSERLKRIPPPPVLK